MAKEIMSAIVCVPDPDLYTDPNLQLHYEELVHDLGHIWERVPEDNLTPPSSCTTALGDATDYKNADPTEDPFWEGVARELEAQVGHLFSDPPQPPWPDQQIKTERSPDGCSKSTELTSCKPVGDWVKDVLPDHLEKEETEKEKMSWSSVKSRRRVPEKTSPRSEAAGRPPAAQLYSHLKQLLLSVPSPDTVLSADPIAQEETLKRQQAAVDRARMRQPTLFEDLFYVHPRAGACSAGSEEESHCPISGKKPYAENSVSEVICQLSSTDCVSTSQEYTSISYQRPDLMRRQEAVYLADSDRLARDARRHALYRSDAVPGKLAKVSVDLTDLVPGFAKALGKYHLLNVFFPDPGADLYGVVYSLSDLLVALGFRTGGSANNAVSSVLVSDDLSTELKSRVVRLTVSRRQQQTTTGHREYFSDIHTLRQFCLAFGLRQRKLGGSGASQTSSSLCSRIRTQLADDRISTDLALRLLCGVYVSFS